MARHTDTASGRIALITRLRTQNAGNEALSAGLIDFVKRENPGAEVRAMDRYPRYLEHLQFSDLARHRDGPVAAFDAAADRLLSRFPADPAGALEAKAEVEAVRLDPTAQELPLWIRRIKRLVGFRRNLARWGLIEGDRVRRTFNTLAWADLLIWNAAGEIHPSGDANQAFRILLLVRIAQKLGRKTCVVNHSVEVDDDVLRKLIQHVYTQCDRIAVRDPASFKVATALQVESGRLILAPDLVFLSRDRDAPASAAVAEVPAGAIGLSINGLETASGIDEWDALLTGLKTFGRPLVFVSNAMNHDVEFARALSARHGVVVIERQPSAMELRALYAGMQVLISSRLHASILAMCEGVPVVSIEPQVFKLTAIFEQLAYPVATESIRHAGWSERVRQKVQLAIEQHDALARAGHEGIGRQTERIREGYSQIFALLAGASVTPRGALRNGAPESTAGIPLAG